MKLQPGMTVQSDDRGHYAFCVRCWWKSPISKFPKAQALACTPMSHHCQRKS